MGKKLKTGVRGKITEVDYSLSERSKTGKYGMYILLKVKVGRVQTVEEVMKKLKSHREKFLSKTIQMYVE